MFSLILCIGTCPGPSIIVCTWKRFAIVLSSPSVRNSANCAWSLASAIEPGRRPSPSEYVTSYAAKISHSSSKFVYRNDSLWCARHHAAMIEPPRETMPVLRFAVSGTYARRTPACTVM